MKLINNYILEKLKISKNIKSEKDFKSGDKIFILGLQFTGNEYYVRFYDIFTVTNFQKDKIEYVTNANKNIKLNIFLNSNNYYEINTASTRAVMFDLYDAYEFLNEIKDKELTKEMLISIFDKTDKYEIEENNIKHIEGDIENILKEIQKLK